ncbi:hypothetical protein C8Q74DRAFT_1257436 [Fomes fomentarius]|nr:hypothetical protein C8Q74DRAFT_1257436 [Fomes fomentarius]
MTGLLTAIPGCPLGIHRECVAERGPSSALQDESPLLDTYLRELQLDVTRAQPLICGF